MNRHSLPIWFGCLVLMLAESVQGEDNASPGLGGAEDEPRAEAPAETDTQGEETDSYDEIIVTGRLEVEAAKQEVIQDLQSEGYTELKRKKNYLLLRHPSNWKGEIRLYDDGWVLMKRQPIRFVAPAVPWAKENSPLAVVSCLLYPTACIRVGGQMVSRAKLVPKRRERSRWPEKTCEPGVNESQT